MYERILDGVYKDDLKRSSQFIVLPCLYAENHWRLFAFDLANKKAMLYDSKIIEDTENLDDFNMIKETFLKYWFVK